MAVCRRTWPNGDEGLVNSEAAGEELRRVELLMSGRELL